MVLVLVLVLVVLMLAGGAGGVGCSSNCDLHLLALELPGKLLRTYPPTHLPTYPHILTPLTHCHCQA